ncbi:MAG: hypothetical protein PHS82_12715 [Lachnospiraceae bacterium]|nr:hypothetical protein [Lachnospiraceae bacterium]
MDKTGKPDWEKYFVEQEIFLRKQKKKRNRRWMIAGCFAAVCLCLLIPLALKRQLDHENSEYVKVMKEAETYDYDTVKQNMVDYLNGKYGAGAVKAEQLNPGQWSMDGSSSELVYKCFEATLLDNAEKSVYAIYLSEDKAVYFDNYQWPKIKKALEEDVLKRSGLDAACARPAVQHEGTYELTYRESPWIICPAYQAYFDGDLQTFFDREYNVRKQLAHASDAEKNMRLCGTMSLFLSDNEHSDMRARMTNPALDYEKNYEQALKDMEDLYHLDMLSCVLPNDYYQNLITYYNRDLAGMQPTSLYYLDDGEGTGFFYSGYTLLSWAYDTLYKPMAEQTADGIYLVPNNGTGRADTFTYESVETPADARSLAESQYREWDIAESFQITTEGIDGSMTALILDLEKRYPGREVQLIAQSGDHPVAAAETVEDGDMWLYYNNEVFQRDNYLFVPPIYAWNARFAYTFTVLVK